MPNSFLKEWRGLTDILVVHQAIYISLFRSPKFEEGVFSDLRNLKPGVDPCLEEPKVSTFFPLSL